MKKIWLVLVIPVVLASCGSTPTPSPVGQIQTSTQYLSCQDAKLTTSAVQNQPTVPINPPKPSTGGGC